MFSTRTTMGKRFVVFALALVAVLLTAGWAAAQLPTGTISGVVKDASGAVMPGASVTVANTETGLTRTGVAGADGTYKFPALPVGTYEIRVEHPGFQRAIQSGLKLNVGQEAVMNFSLQVGAVEQTVAVTAEAPMIETTSATVSGLVAENEVRDLPLNARNLVELATLFPGVSLARTGGQGVPNGFATKLTIMGSRYNSSLFQMDGQDINDNTGSAGGAAGILMGVETVQEFNVVSSGFSAEYGKHTGGVFNAVTKSGTNSIHGSVFEFFRNDKLDAPRWEDNAFAGGEKPPYKRNQYGFSLGGPILRDKTFFFGSYEALRERKGETSTFRVPGVEMRSGILPVPGGVTTANCTASGGTLEAGNTKCRIPVAPAINKWLQAYPLATPGLPEYANGTADFSKQESQPTNEDFYSIRLDQKIGEKDTLFGRYTIDDADQVPSFQMGTHPLSQTRAQYATISETRLVSPEVINVFMVAYNRSRIAQTNEATLPRPQNTFTAFENIDGAFGTVGASPLAGWSGCNTCPSAALLNQYQVKNDAFYTRGSHSFKFGFNFQRMQYNRKTYDSAGGTFSFSRLDQYLAGRPVNTFNALMPDVDISVYPRQSLYGLYAQDDIRLKPNFTLNLGLRYEFVSVPYVLNDRYSNLHDYWTPGQTPNDVVLGNPVWLNPSLKNYAPRVGFAWDVRGDGKTSVRGGIGLFYDQILVGPLVYSFVAVNPFYALGNLNAAQNPSFPDAYFTQLSLTTPRVEQLQYKMDQPTVLKYSLDIQRALSDSTSLEIGGSATRAWHLMRVVLANPSQAFEQSNGRLLVPMAAQRGLPAGVSNLIHPAFGRLRPKQTDGSSNYFAFRLQLNQRAWRGLQMRLSYTFSKSMDTGSAFAGSNDFGNESGAPRYLGLQEKALSAFDLRNALSANFTYDLPGRDLTGVAGHVLGGWQLSGIITVQDGNPFSPDTGLAPAQFTNIVDYPDAIAGSKPSYDARNPNRYFDPSMFTIPTLTAHDANVAHTRYIGNLGRNILIGPGLATINAVLAKNFRLMENASLQFRSEFHNLFNRPNFGSPESTIFDSGSLQESDSVGLIQSTATNSRQFQLGLKIVF